MSRRIGLSLVVLVIVCTFAWLTAGTVSARVVTDTPAPQLNECLADAGTVEAPEQGALESSAKPCRPCQGREWCGCTYPGGYTRISCDPCCYINYAGEITCLD